MSRPKIIVFDLETLPDPREIYKRIPSIGNWPGRTRKAELQSVMCFGYKELGAKTARSINLWDFPAWKKDRKNDKALLFEARKILNEADGIITHNGIKFDMKVLNTRFGKHKIPPLPKVKHMDTSQVLRKHYSLYSNSLDAAAKFFDIEQKMDIDNKWDLWERIAFKEETKADLKIMDKYCKQDVSTTEALFYEVRGHISNIPNYSLFIDPKDNPKQVCPNCGSQHTYKNGRHVTTTRTYQRYGCWTCGTPFRTDTKDKNPRAFS